MTIAARGVSAHGSTPEEGVNALVVLCQGLEELVTPTGALALGLQWAADTTGGAFGKSPDATTSPGRSRRTSV